MRGRPIPRRWVIFYQFFFIVLGFAVARNEVNLKAMRVRLAILMSIAICWLNIMISWYLPYVSVIAIATGGECKAPKEDTLSVREQKCFRSNPDSVRLHMLLPDCLGFNALRNGVLSSNE